MQDDSKDQITPTLTPETPSTPMPVGTPVPVLTPTPPNSTELPQPADSGGIVPPTTPTAVDSMGEHVPGEPNSDKIVGQEDISQATVMTEPSTNPSNN